MKKKKNKNQKKLGSFRFHKVESDILSQAGFEDVANFAKENTIYQFKATETGRLLGIKINYVFYILGFDPNHNMY